MTVEDLKARNLESEFVFSATRSSGPGGQNINKVNTRVEIRFNVLNSLLLSDEEKYLLKERLGKKISSNGDLLSVSQSSRSQLENRKKATEKLYRLLSNALTVRKARKKTLPTPGSVIKRLEKKRIKSVIKKSRKRSDLMPEG